MPKIFPLVRVVVAGVLLAAWSSASIHSQAGAPTDPSTSLGAGGDGYRAVLPLIRMGRGKMMGVDYNKGLAWVGATAGLVDETL